MDETKGIIAQEQFALMKPGAIIVNTARGGVVDEDAMLKALHENRIGGAVLDVFSSEPLPADSPLLKLNNVFCTPHIAGYTVEACKGISLLAANKLLEYYES